jgi:hypothetical protein
MQARTERPAALHLSHLVHHAADDRLNLRQHELHTQTENHNLDIGEQQASRRRALIAEQTAAVRSREQKEHIQSVKVDSRTQHRKTQSELILKLSNEGLQHRLRPAQTRTFGPRYGHWPRMSAARSGCLRHVSKNVSPTNETTGSNKLNLHDSDKETAWDNAQNEASTSAAPKEAPRSTNKLFVIRSGQGHE